MINFKYRLFYYFDNVVYFHVAQIHVQSGTKTNTIHHGTIHLLRSQYFLKNIPPFLPPGTYFRKFCERAK